MDKEQQKRDVREAIEAGNITLGLLNQAWNELNSASSFGLADLFGLDIIGGIGKHIKIDAAKKALTQAQQQVVHFQKELADLGNSFSQSVDIDGVWSFMDFALDGLIVDFLMQDKIDKAKNNVNTCIEQVDQILEELHQLEKTL